MKIVLANQFKNEGSRIVEWLSYYRDRGITNFILCNDHSTDDSIDKIKSVESINCLIIDSSQPKSKYHNSKDTESYSGDCSVAISISNNFKKIKELTLKVFGNEVILGFFDVDEFLIGKTKNLSEEIINATNNFLMVSVCSFEVDSDLFNLDSNIPLLKQTTKSMSVKNRSLCTRKTTFKSLLNLSKDEKKQFCSLDPNTCGNCGGFAHAGGVDRSEAFGVPPYRGFLDLGGHDPIIPTKEFEEWYSPNKKWCLIAPEKLIFLHYRISKKEQKVNKKLFDMEYTIP